MRGRGGQGASNGSSSFLGGSISGVSIGLEVVGCIGQF
jgi:hypothetical protein